MKRGLGIGDWGLGTGDWGLGIGNWGLGKNSTLSPLTPTLRVGLRHRKRSKLHPPLLPYSPLPTPYFHAKAAAGCGQRPTALPITAHSCIKWSKASGVRDCGPSDRAFLGLG